MTRRTIQGLGLSQERLELALQRQILADTLFHRQGAQQLRLLGCDVLPTLA
jgi:hypothetical protein